MGVNGPVVRDDISAQCQNQGESLLGHAIVVGSRGDRHDDVVAGRGLQIDQVIADAGPGDDPEPGRQIEEVRGQVFAAGEHGVGHGQILLQLLMRESQVALGVDQVKAGIRESFAKWTRLVTKEIGPDQDGGHDHALYCREEPILRTA